MHVVQKDKNIQKGVCTVKSLSPHLLSDNHSRLFLISPEILYANVSCK